MRSDKKRSKFWLIAIPCLVILLAGGWFLWGRLENENPVLSLDLPSAYIGQSRELTVTLKDARSGLRKVWIGLLKDGKETVLHAETFPSAGFLEGGRIHEDSVKINVEPAILGFADGDAVLRVVVSDYSWRDWWRGNHTHFEKKVIIDTKPPEIEVLSRSHNINQGGTGLVVFRTSEACSQSGVQVGDKFFPGYTGYFDNPLVYLAFIALDFEQNTDTEMFVKAADLAGNPGKGGLNYHLRHREFRHDRINISDGFLKRKIADFPSEVAGDANQSLLDKFLSINRDLRKANYQTIVEVCRQSDAKMYWKGDFLRLPKSANRAGFADHRIYLHNGREIDRQVHLGIDLASVAQSTVPAANDGVVVLAERVGIYGKTVILDHGFGVFSMYAHLSHIGVNVGDRPARGDILGRTGMTGLAGGDHLHFSMLIHGTFVNPVEWWDMNWIQHNVLAKLEEAGSATLPQS